MENSCFNGCYQDLIDLIGHEHTLLLYETYAGQYLSLPKKLLSDEYIHALIKKEYDGKNAKELARKYKYTYSWLMKILKN